MFFLILTFGFLALAIGLPIFARRRGGALTESGKPLGARLTPAGLNGISIASGFLALFCFIQPSIVRIPADQVGLVRKIYGGTSLPQGHFIAMNGETGYQATIIPPGAFHIWPFFKVLNEVDLEPLVTVPTGFYGRIVTKDGDALPEGQIMADEWPDADFAKYLDAEYFMQHGGQKGLQASVLKPGIYPLNLSLYEIKIGHVRNGRDVTDNSTVTYDVKGESVANDPLDTSITIVPSGSVGVVRSNVQPKNAECTPITANTDQGGLSAALVPRGCKGIWGSSLEPNDYYLNRDAYDVTLVDTRVQALEFKGGYTRRFIDLKVDQAGNFTQTERKEDVAFDPKTAADSAVVTKVEGWEVPQELRAVVQISPEHAPIVVAAVGGMDAVEKRIMVPAIRSHVRNVFGGTITVTETDEVGKTTPSTRTTKVLDLVTQRPTLEQAILSLVQGDGRRAGVDVKEIRLSDSIIPPELLLARQRQQLAGQLKQAYEQEQIAQQQRQQSEQAKATADKQADLVAAQIEVQKAELRQKQRTAEGAAERAYMEQLAAGQTAQANVIGKESVLTLQMQQNWLNLLGQHPELVANLKLPQIYVSGDQGLSGAASIFGLLSQKPAGAAGK